ALVRPWHIAVGSALALGLFVAAGLYWRTAHTAPAPEPEPTPTTTHMVLPPDPVPPPSPSHIEPAAARHLVLARNYIMGLWSPDGRKECARAIELARVARWDPRATEAALKCLESNRGGGPAVLFLAEPVGPPAERRLRQIAEQPRLPPEIRRAAEDALA